MRIDKGVMVALGYGKFFRSDSIVGLEPIEEDRGPGRRTHVYVEDIDQPFIASRSENAILRDLTGVPRSESKGQERYELLSDILDTIGEINPLAPIDHSRPGQVGSQPAGRADQRDPG
jgi:hypothetical protein